MPKSYKTDVLQRRRMRAATLHTQGWRIIDIANALHVSSAAVSQWIKAYKQHGERGLEATPKTGATKRLTTRHQLLLRALLADTPREHGIDADVWSRRLLQQAIKRLFGVSYSLQHVGRLIASAKHEKSPLPRVTRLELHDLIKKSDIARIRSRIAQQHGIRKR